MLLVGMVRALLPQKNELIVLSVIGPEADLG
jgi:hypothetical protein